MPGALGGSLLPISRIAASYITSPTTLDNVFIEIYPGRRIIGVSSVISTIVDSSPIIDEPPSRIISILPSKSLFTCEALVGDGRPDKLAEGAATNPPAALINSSAILLSGILTATVSSPPVVS